MGSIVVGACLVAVFLMFLTSIIHKPPDGHA